jgi:hypothetical protein
MLYFANTARSIVMNKADVWKVRAAELRRMANMAREAEKERKMLALADAFEEAANANEQSTTAAGENG